MGNRLSLSCVGGSRATSTADRGAPQPGASPQASASPTSSDGHSEPAPSPMGAQPSAESLCTPSGAENGGDLQNLPPGLGWVNLPRLGLMDAGSLSSSSSSSFLSSANSAERAGAFGQWAVQICLEGHSNFHSAAHLARRHCRPGTSERVRVASLLAEHGKQKYGNSSHLLSGSTPLLEGASPSAAAEVLHLLRVVAALTVIVNGRASKSHVSMTVVLLAIGKHVRMLQSASRIVGRDLLTELHTALPDKILIAFRGKLANRLRSEPGVASLVKMLKLIPSVVGSSNASGSSSKSLQGGGGGGSSSAKGPGSSSGSQHARRHTVPGMLSSGAWTSIASSQGEINSLLDSKAHDILDSAFSMGSPRPPLSPSSLQSTPRPQMYSSSRAGLSLSLPSRIQETRSL